MSHQGLNGSNISPSFQKMGGKTMAISLVGSPYGIYLFLQRDFQYLFVQKHKGIHTQAIFSFLTFNPPHC